MSSKKKKNAPRQSVSPSVTKYQYEIRWKWLLGSLLVVLIAVPVLFFLHRHQLERTSERVLANVTAFEKEGKWREAVSLLSAYLELNPEDASAVKRLARHYDENTHSGDERARTLRLYRRALALAPEKEKIELGLRLAEMQFEDRRFLEAMKLAEEVLREEPENFEASKLYALSALERWYEGTLSRELDQNKMVDDLLTEALALSPGEPELTVALAELLRNTDPQREVFLSQSLRELSMQKRIQQADQAIDAMVAEKGDIAESYLARYRYRRKYRLPVVEEDLEKALEIAPEDPEVLEAASEHAFLRAVRESEPSDAGKASVTWEEAVSLLNQLLEIEPANESAYIMLGELYQRRGETKKAKRIWREGVALRGQKGADLNMRLISVLLAEGDLQGARSELEVFRSWIHEQRPFLSTRGQNTMEAMYGLLYGQWLAADEKPAEAIQTLERSLQLARDLSVPSYLVGRSSILYAGLLAQQGKWDIAAKAYERAFVVPTMVPLAAMLASENWLRAGQPKNAIEVLEEALKINENPMVHLALARARLRFQKSRSPKQRQWDALEEEIEKIRRQQEQLARPWELAILTSEWKQLQHADGSEGRQAALEVLREAEKQFAENVAFQEVLILRYAELNSMEDSQRLLERLLDDPATQTLGIHTQARRQLAQGKQEAAKKTLREALESLPDDAPDRAPLERLLTVIEQEKEGGASLSDRLDQLQEEKTSDVRSLFLLANLELDRREFLEAKSVEEQLRELEGDAGVYWQFLQARRLAETAEGPDDDRLQDAEKLLEKVLGKRPHWAMAYLLKAMIGKKAEKLSEAIDGYETAIELGNRELAVYVDLIRLLRKAGMDDKVHDYEDQMQELFPSAARMLFGPTVPDSYEREYRLFQDAVRGDRLEQAEKIAEDWIAKLDQQSESDILKSQSLAAIGWIWMQSGNLEKAIFWLEQLAAMGPGYTYPLAVALARDDKPVQAYRLLLDAYQEEPENPLLLNSFLRLMTQLPVPEEVKEDTENALRQIASFLPKNLKNSLQLAMIWDRLGDREEVIGHYRAALESDSESMIVLNNLAAVLGQEESTRREALELIDQAIAIEPDSPILLDTKALILLGSGTPGAVEKAVSLLEKATEIEPELKNHQLHLALAYLRANEKKKAADVVERYLKGVDPAQWSPKDKEYWKEIQHGLAST